MLLSIGCHKYLRTFLNFFLSYINNRVELTPAELLKCKSLSDFKLNLGKDVKKVNWIVITNLFILLFWHIYFYLTYAYVHIYTVF